MAASRRSRVQQALHAAQTEGVTISDLAEQTELPKHVVKELLQALLNKHQAVLLAARRNPETNDLDEVWGCRCRLGHQPKSAPGRAHSFAPVHLDDVTRQRGLSGVEQARAELAEAKARVEARRQVGRVRGAA